MKLTWVDRGTSQSMGCTCSGRGSSWSCSCANTPWPAGGSAPTWIVGPLRPPHTLVTAAAPSGTCAAAPLAAN